MYAQIETFLTGIGSCIASLPSGVYYMFLAMIGTVLVYRVLNKFLG